MNVAYTDSYIAFLDILGFKQMVGMSECQSIFDIFSVFKNHMRSIEIWLDKENGQYVDCTKVRMKVMSDSICFFVDASDLKNLLALIAVCQNLQCVLLDRAEPKLLRGAIVRGNIFQRDDIIFGPGLIKAYQKEENETYPRVVLDSSVLQDIDNAAGNSVLFPIWKLIKGKIEIEQKYYIERIKEQNRFEIGQMYYVDYIEEFDGTDTDGVKMKELDCYADKQIRVLPDGAKKKWMWFRDHLKVYLEDEVTIKADVRRK